MSHSLNILLDRLHIYEGKTLQELHYNLYSAPIEKMTKGLTGRLLEQLLGVTNLCESTPDLPDLGLEIKTLPISAKGIVKEHTFLSTISLPFLEGSFLRSKLYRKIANILWIPIIRPQPYMSAFDIIGKAFIISLDSTVLPQLIEDWDLLASYLRTDEYRFLSSDLGEILHIRPKAKNAMHSVLVGNQRVNPIGFYFRKGYTQSLLNQSGIK